MYSGTDGTLHISIPSQAHDLMNLDQHGNLRVYGKVSSNSLGFLLDHPLDPANKSLSHSAVSSPERKTIYDGVALLDSYGKAEVTLPPWFEELNTMFRYQLTALGASAPGLYIAQEIKGNRFTIAGGLAGLKVCWQVTGIRQDAWARANPFVVEEDRLAELAEQQAHPETFQRS